MTIKELKEIIKDLSDDTLVEVNAIFDEDKNDLVSTNCDIFYHETNKKLYITPDIISI